MLLVAVTATDSLAARAARQMRENLLRMTSLLRARAEDFKSASTQTR